MTQQIDRTGTFRGSIVDFGLAKTKNDYPQLVLALHGEEYYDEDEKVWVSWEGVEESDITAYLVLFGSEQLVMRNVKQVQKALGWDGLSFSSLAKIDSSKIKVQFRVESRLYNNQTTLQVNWIDAYDAEPGRIISKLTEAEIKTLDAQYSSTFKKLAGGQQVKPVSASDLPWTKPTGPQTIIPEKPVEQPTQTEQPKSAKKTTKPSTKKQTDQTTGCTADQAWDACITAKPKATSEDKLAEIWVETVCTIAPDKDEEKMTPDLWVRVRDIVIERVKDDVPF